MLRIGGVEELGVIVHMHFDQALLALIADDVDVVADKFHRFGIAKAHQRNAPQDLALQRQLDQFGVFIGDSKQAFAHGVVGQGRDIVVEPFDHLAFEGDAIIRQANGALIRRLVPHLPVEPGAFEQTELLCHQPGSD